MRKKQRELFRAEYPNKIVTPLIKLPKLVSPLKGPAKTLISVKNSCKIRMCFSGDSAEF